MVRQLLFPSFACLLMVLALLPFLLLSSSGIAAHHCTTGASVSRVIHVTLICGREVGWDVISARGGEGEDGRER